MRLPPLSRRLVGGVMLLCLGCTAPAAPADPAMVTEWFRAWYGVARVERLSPPVTSRLLAYHAAALHAGLAAVDPTAPAVPLNGLPTLPPADPALDPTRVAVAALRVVSDSLLAEALPTTRAALARLADSLTATRAPRWGRRARAAASDAHGARIGIALVAWARADGFTATRGRPYTPPAGPGRWVNDAPAPLFATQKTSGASETVFLDDPTNRLRPGRTSDRALILSRPKDPARRTLPAVDMSGASEPYWGTLRPFVLASWDACPVPPPPAYDTRVGSALHVAAAEVLRVARALTPAERTIALFWADNAGETGTPAGHWLAITGQVARAHALSARDAAWVAAATTAAVADAFIAAWGYKYRDATIRPRTYIRRVLDPRWEPAIPTPPFPEHPAGHATQSAAAAAVLTARFGAVPVVDSSSVALGHAPRPFASFAAAADEAARSRLYGGIHFRTGNDAGRTLGACIGGAVATRFGMTP